MNFGHILEGTVEQDPLTDQFGIRTVHKDGRTEFIDVTALLLALKGQDVRLTLASLENIAELARLVEAQGGGEVQGIMPEDFPEVPFDIRRKG